METGTVSTPGNLEKIKDSELCSPSRSSVLWLICTRSHYSKVKGQGPLRKRGQKERKGWWEGEKDGEGWLTSGCDPADVCRQQLTAALVTCTKLGQSEFQQGGGAPEALPLLDSYW